ncbi:MAG: 2-dehydropantoate 2-reductase [Epsilonproteobacteria bacterium]|nr:hypothetical protein [Campylobacterota bacterium]NPA56355.1 2-dehydropantoate 2-reductase [Campylobacterota bacterium]
MKILVVGGGGVGGYIAAKLSRCFHVDLLSQSLNRVILVEEGEEREYQIPIYRDPPQKRYDLIIFAVKSPQLKEYATKIAPIIQEKTLILPLLNGIQPYEELRKLLPKGRVVKGAIYVISNRGEGDRISVKGRGALVITESEEIANLFQECGLKGKAPDNIDRAIWQKYLFIAATAGLTSLYNIPFGEVASHHLQEFEELLDEIISIAGRKGIELGEEEKRRAIELLKKSPPESKTSLQLDLEKGKEGELENLIGYLARESLPFREIYEKLKEDLRHNS